jgi:hypothetical protein
MEIKFRSINEETLDGKILVLREGILDPKYQEIGYRLHRATGGFGCSPTAIGRAVFAKCLGDGEEARWSRNDFEGWLTEEEASALMVKERVVGKVSNL